MMERVVIVGTGLIGSSIALALRAAGFAGVITGVDRSERERAAARGTGAFSAVWADGVESGEALRVAEVVVLAAPVLAILEWMERLAPVLQAGQLVTDVGSTKREIARAAERLYGGPGRAEFLPGHPMAGKESGGAARGDAGLFEGAMWLFTPTAAAGALGEEWRGWVERMGARTREMAPARHDELCAWVSHLPQFLATALSALLEERFGAGEEIAAIGGRALGEMTRLGASPYSMWRDIALTNGEAIGATLQALEQEIAHLRENLRTPELREEFRRANRLRLRGGG